MAVGWSVLAMQERQTRCVAGSGGCGGVDDRRESLPLIRSGRVHCAASGHSERHVACPHPTAGTLSAAT